MIFLSVEELCSLREMGQSSPFALTNAENHCLIIIKKQEKQDGQLITENNEFILLFLNLEFLKLV